ncbi:MAG: nucleoside hydrolase, partial [Pseudomonadales bacterium]
FLAQHPKAKLLAVTTNGAGETRCDPALRNIPALLALSDANPVPFACGDDYPLDGFFAFPEPWRLQADTLSGVNIPTIDLNPAPGHAVELIHATLVAADQPVVLVATGSLTNIAQWLERYPQDRDKVDRLVIMGGAFEHKGNIIVPNFTDGHPNVSAEWNIFVDPLAAAQVFAAGLALEVVGLDVTNDVQVTAEFAAAFKRSTPTPAARFWDQVLDDNDWFIASGEYYFWDVLAAIVALEPEFCQGTMEPAYVTVETTERPAFEDDSIPPTRIDGSKRRHLDPGRSGITRTGGNGPVVKVCRETSGDAALALFADTLKRR